MSSPWFVLSVIWLSINPYMPLCKEGMVEMQCLSFDLPSSFTAVLKFPIIGKIKGNEKGVLIEPGGE